MHTEARIAVLASIFSLAALAPLAPLRADDCKWPPLNPEVQRQSDPVRVGDHTFTTGHYSYHVAAYQIAALHCATSIAWGPREWAVVIGLGGAEEIGPRTRTGTGAGAGTEGTEQPRTVRASTLPARPQVPLQQLPSLNQLPRLSPIRPLPQGQLPNLQSLPPLGAATGALPPLRDLPPLSP